MYAPEDVIIHRDWKFPREKTIKFLYSIKGKEFGWAKIQNIFAHVISGRPFTWHNRIVHHIDRNHQHNRLYNLCLMPNCLHSGEQGSFHSIYSPIFDQFQLKQYRVILKRDFRGILLDELAHKNGIREFDMYKIFKHYVVDFDGQK